MTFKSMIITSALLAMLAATASQVSAQPQGTLPDPQKLATAEISVFTDLLALDGYQQDRLQKVLETFHKENMKNRPASGQPGMGRMGGGPPQGGHQGGMGMNGPRPDRMANNPAFSVKEDSLKQILNPEQWQTYQDNKKKIQELVREKLNEDL
ncbi:MAG: hypothetical protein J0L62_09640 [Bacteroidetes bacterium]|nr:hypothetical protein [Bacteroidota bacterium]